MEGYKCRSTGDLDKEVNVVSDERDTAVSAARAP